MDTGFEFRSVLIYGVGLMGASLARSLKSKDRDIRITGVVRTDKSKKHLLEKHYCDQVYLEKEFDSIQKDSILSEIDLVILGTPVTTIRDQIRLFPLVDGPIITDMGSTKQTIVDSVEKYFSEIQAKSSEKILYHNYISSHPMCGSELSGPENSVPDLYTEKLCILTGLKHSNPDNMPRLKKFWTDLGMFTHTLSDLDHDRILAFLSHSPHVISSILVEWADRNIGRENSESPKPILGGGFRDMARIGGSNPEMWASILEENRENIVSSLEEFQKDLSQVIALLKTGKAEDFRKLFQSAGRAKSHLLHSESESESE
jgi:prephenate dehydrogenase